MSFSIPFETDKFLLPTQELWIGGFPDWGLSMFSGGTHKTRCDVNSLKAMFPRWFLEQASNMACLISAPALVPWRHWFQTHELDSLDLLNLAFSSHRAIGEGHEV